MHIGPKNVEIRVITYNGREKGSVIPREIISIFGMPFYRSSGSNSGYANTWFPFYGLNEYGAFLKRQSEHKTFSLPEIFHKIFQLEAHNVTVTADLPARFGTLGCLLISSLLGGGLWESDRGRTLLKELRTTYPTFYNTWAALELLDCEKFYENDDFQLINQWLIEQAGVKSIMDLQQMFHRNFDELIKYQDRRMLTQTEDESTNDKRKSGGCSIF